jgi:DNA-binding response OmpR family regulator/anti-sigma regulatory factor (Ser/Thr protein kinase)
MTTEPIASILAIVADPAISTNLKELLAGTTFRLKFAASAEEGLRQAEVLLPTVILLDIDLNRLNPFETCRRLRATPVLASMPVVMLADRNDRDARAIGLSAGADDFLNKPFDGLELLARLQTIARLNTHRLLLADLKRFSWMVDNAKEGYLMLDKSGAIQYANEQAMDLLNLPEDSSGLPFGRVVERLYIAEPEEVWKNWIDEPEPFFLLQPESPTARAVWLVVEALDSPFGVDQHRIVRLRDVTERMSIYHDMRRFHTVVAHKLRTPMSIMVSNLSIIKNKLDMLTPDEVKEFARTAVGGAERLANEIRKILTYIDAPLALNLGEPMALIALPEMVQGICETMSLKDVSVSMPDYLRETLIALTPDAMEMVLQELLENARKFHPKHAPRVEISVGQTDPGFLRMRITDDGVTLSIEQLKWAWLPYVQGEKEFTGELPGLGIGFPMVATLIWKAGGDVHLRNRPDGPGVIVDLTIPFVSTMRQLEYSAAPYGE